MIEKIHVACCASDVWLARICVASIRYWYPDIPICLLRDYARGRFSTDEIEHFWQVSARDCDPQYSGWSFTKLELFFQPIREKFLFVDADIVMTGPLLDAVAERTEQFIVSPDLIADPVHHPVMGVYYDYAKLRALDPEFQFPGFVFNAGQFIATSGVLTQEDFASTVEWSRPLKVRRPDLFFCSEQGILNYTLPRQAQRQRLTLGTATLYYDGRSDEATALVFQPPQRNAPFLLHWPGVKMPLASQMPRGDILSFFEQHYYSRIPAGRWKRLTRGLGRWIRHVRRRLPIWAYGFVPESGRRVYRRVATLLRLRARQ